MSLCDQCVGTSSCNRGGICRFFYPKTWPTPTKTWPGFICRTCGRSESLTPKTCFYCQTPMVPGTIHISISECPGRDPHRGGHVDVKSPKYDRFICALCGFDPNKPRIRPPPPDHTKADARGYVRAGIRHQEENDKLDELCKWGPGK